ncbi:hypothetical protein RF11_15839 [Thelohanellus kitauei]|uniref:Uncharacterized protein n=1 Tax=Thelohanellus kitauei TaxID=669202 RepID=A0A0C2M413_THEKT|nr:hypothetical protein RF11_15839 [Thelohanellus kitauei]
MSRENMILALLFSVALSQLMNIEENYNFQIYHTYEELSAEKRLENVLQYNFESHQFNGKYNEKIFLDLGTENTNLNVCQDKNEKLIYLYVVSLKSLSESFGIFLININTHKFYKIIIKSGQKKQAVNISRIWCSFGALYAYDEETNHVLMKLEESDEFMAFHFEDGLENMVLDESNKYNLALLTGTKEVNKKINSVVRVRC